LYAATDARLLTVDAAEVVEHPVAGLQRAAIPLAWGLAVDTAVLADLTLTPNLGLRWAREWGEHRIVLGARYAHFVGAQVYRAILASTEPAIQRFEPTLFGPSAYAVYGFGLERFAVQFESRYSYLHFHSLALTAAASWNFAGAWWLVAEGGARFFSGPIPRGALGVRYVGEQLGITLGAAYVGISDPFFTSLPVLPALDVSWSFR
jgi:hypothetical protein